MLNLYATAIESGYCVLSKISPCSAWTHFKELQASQWLSHEQLSRRRWKKLKALLSFSYKNTPFYRNLWKKHGIDPQSFGSEKDMLMLPIVTKEELTGARERGEFLLDRRGAYQMSSTSGTTGIRFNVPFTFSTYQKKYANHLRQVYASGWRLGMKSATLHYSGHAQFKGTYDGQTHAREPYQWFREQALRVAHRRLVLTPYYEEWTGNDSLIESWYHQLKRYKPFLFETMDINILMLKDFIEKNNLPRLAIPKTFVLTTFSPRLKKILEDFFHTEIFDRYSPHEMEGVAFACQEHNGMHMAIDSYHIEFMDDNNQPAGPEEPAHLVITDLDNYLMPLIRYKIGDLGHYYEGLCGCGRGLPLMGEIDGRTRDCMVLKNGKKIPPSHITRLLQDEPSIRFFQVLQNNDDPITVNIVPHDTLFSRTVAENIKNTLQQVLGRDENIAIVPVKNIKLETNGKYSFVKSKARVGIP